MTARFVCIRDDDSSEHTPIRLLEDIRRQVWLGRPVTYGWVPYASPGSFQRELPSHSAGLPHSAPPVNEALSVWVADGTAEVALHGLTHDDRCSGGRSVPEFSMDDPALAERAIKELRRMNRLFGSRFFIPPHNQLHEQIGAALLRAGFHICRSIDDDDIARLASQRETPLSREEAKRLLPFRCHGAAVEVFQTLLLSKRRIARLSTPPEKLVEAISAALETSGLAIVTVHWWDFADVDGGLDRSFARYMGRVLDLVEAAHQVTYCTLSAAARHVAAGDL